MYGGHSHLCGQIMIDSPWHLRAPRGSFDAVLTSSCGWTAAQCNPQPGRHHYQDDREDGDIIDQDDADGDHIDLDVGEETWISRVLGLIAGVCAGCCIDKNALIALTFDDDCNDNHDHYDYDLDDDYYDNGLNMA